MGIFEIRGIVPTDERPPGPGDLPRSGGLFSPLCSNMARRFLTPDMVRSGCDWLSAKYVAVDEQEELRSVCY